MKISLKSFISFLFLVALVSLFCFQYLTLKSVLFGSIASCLFQLRQFNSASDENQTTSRFNFEPSTHFNVDSMSAQEMLDYLLWTNRTSCRLAHDFGGQMNQNPSGYDGQKTVCLDPVQLAPPAGRCLVYSFGINNEWSFDEAMANYGCQIYSFDPSMSANDHDHTPSIHFFNLGLTGRDTTTNQGWHLRSLSSIYQMLKSRHGHKVIDYLKIDIEFGEWSAIPQIIQSGMMDKVRQLAIEIHLIHQENLEQMRDRIRVVRSIEEHGMIRFDSKLNPWSMVQFAELDNSTQPFAYEIAWYNSKFL